ncbi:putative DNA modification/repair radical SAM protein [Clostridium cavendishii DSM 21758]|uniref:Putative DNA modification/repair radical SAM protein n=1 Tax=Clostridium cavendishii DSM 21758 TaxID=1121302 RepID=A0A1M6AK98_9CLOT|nr:putative DNA modification/repair radical SAM protein [Clostridium cavendishii]SHI36633.1 putative DNA modification/repair radical SAM protein [Clostridium cavendishii DSM 21758]
MDIQEKLTILSAAAKYDVSCSSSGSNRKNTKSGIGNAASSGICHSFTPDGRCISLLKILLTNYCIYDCSYCINRNSNDVQRACFTPEEVIDLTINFYKRNYIEGLFLSSAIFKSPNYTMELLLKVIKSLRVNHKFNGYIHVKAIPGADEALIKEAGLYADRMSVNIELPSSQSLKLLAPQKNKDKIIKPMNLISKEIKNNLEEKKKFKKASLFVPGGQSTQLIVGASREDDRDILNLSENLYTKFSLKRVYYSAYVPINRDVNLPNLLHPPTLREHRLYQGDWLLRFYGFKANELLNEHIPNFDDRFDPKTFWALNNLDDFPVEINKAPYETLLRVPGIGVRGAQKIVAARRVCFLNFIDLKKLGIVLKRAQYFITCRGKYYGDTKFDKITIEDRLTPIEFKQLSFFDNLTEDITHNNKEKIKLLDLPTAIHGEI